MADPVLPNELGFSEFVAKLISEMFEAITSAQLDQEKSLAELAQAAELSIEEYGNRYILDDQVALELIRLFPSESADQPSLVYDGASYLPETNKRTERPPIHAELGVTLTEDDYDRSGRKIILNHSAMVKINLAVRTSLAESQQPAIQKILRRGIPRVIADAGKINAKLTYEVVSDEEAQNPQTTSRLAAPVASITTRKFLTVAPSLPKFHLLVRQADERAPQTPNLKVNVFGEVEITFKTVT